MASRSNKLLEEIHPLSIIKEVEKWPVLYSRESRIRDSGNTHSKLKVWHEVANALFSDWKSFNDAEKECKVTDLCKRWRNLRDTFKRQVEIEKKVREGFETKRRPYVYFKQMIFLLPHLTDSDTPDPSVTTKINHYIEKSKKLETKKPRKRKLPLEQHFVEESPISLKGEEIDEDKHFLMSLIPTFKRMNDDEKLTAKMEILKVLRDIRKSSSSGSFMVDSLTHDEPETSIPIKIELLGPETTTSSIDSDSDENK